MIILQNCPICGEPADYSFRERGPLWRQILGLGWTDWEVLCTRDHGHAKAEGRTQEQAATKWNSYKHIKG